MLEAAGVIPVPDYIPIVVCKILFLFARPSDVVSAVIGGQEDAVSLVVCRDDAPYDVKHGMLAQVLLIHA